MVFFYNDNGGVENGGNKELFNTFAENLEQLTFTYKLKATDEWIRAHATDTTSVDVPNTAEIRDSLHAQAHWTAETKVPYLPQHLSKTAKQVGDSNLLQFTLDVNPGGVPFKDNGGKELKYLTVTDNSENLEIQMSTIQVTDTEKQPLKKVPYTEGMELKGDEWAIMPETESGKFQLMVPNGKELLITYDAAIPELGPQTVSNMASIEGIDKSVSGDDYNFNVNNYSASGSGSTYKLNFEKVDSTDENKKLPGATFKFYIVLDDTKADSGSTSEGDSEEGSGSEEGSKDDKLKATDEITVGGKKYSCYSEKDWEFTTDANGVYQIESTWRLAPGNYFILEEIKAPQGYVMLKDPVLFYFGDEKDADTATYPNATAALPNGTLQVGDPPAQYELPETGGIGNTKSYTAGALLALAAISTLLYTTKKRRKEGN